MATLLSTGGTSEFKVDTYSGTSGAREVLVSFHQTGKGVSVTQIREIIASQVDYSTKVKQIVDLFAAADMTAKFIMGSPDVPQEDWDFDMIIFGNGEFYRTKYHWTFSPDGKDFYAYPLPTPELSQDEEY